MAFNFNGNTPKKILYGSANVAKLIYNNVIVWVQKFLSTVTGNTPLTLESATEDNIEEANLYGMTEQRRLPKGYTELEYLESTGTQYIDTNIYVTSKDINVKTKIYTPSMPIYEQDILSTWTSHVSSGKLVLGLHQNKVFIYARSGNGESEDNATSAEYQNEQTFNIDATYDSTQRTKTLVVNGLTTSASYNVDPRGSAKTIRLFRQGSGSNALIGRIYYLVYSEGGVTKLNLIPCKNSSNVLGMYDLVTNTFFTNQGTGDFTAGPAVTPTPDNPMPIWCNNGVVKVSPNLFNGQFDTGWGINVYDGSIMGVSDRMSFYIPVKAGQTYTISRSAVGSSSYFYYGTYALQPYSNYQQCVSYDNIGINALTGTITVPTGANYLAFFFGAGTSPNVQVEYGSTATSYMPYGQVYVDGDVETIEIDTTGDTATAENLLAIGTYKDVQDLISGSVARNVGIKVLDGTEAWNRDISGFYLDYNFNCAPRGNNQCCTHYNYETSQSSYNIQDGEFYIWGTGNRIRFKDDRFSTVQQFVAWLSDQYANGTPVIIVYPLATPTTETVTGQELECQEGTNIVSSNKGSREMEVTYYRN